MYAALFLLGLTLLNGLNLHLRTGSPGEIAEWRRDWLAYAGWSGMATALAGLGLGAELHWSEKMPLMLRLPLHGLACLVFLACAMVLLICCMAANAYWARQGLGKDDSAETQEMNISRPEIM